MEEQAKSQKHTLPGGPYKMDPRYIWYYMIGHTVTLLFIIVLLIGGIFLELTINLTSPVVGLILSLILVLILILGVYGWTRLVYHFYRYELWEDEFRKEYGVINKKYASIPYDRIQNVDISRGLLQRIFGLSEIRIQTAGQSGLVIAEGSLPGLSKENAEDLRELLLDISRTRRTKTQQDGL
ncbi:MAG: PH domain-containing protein [Candidatus Campbellbacteria bacterium]|nr:PH domain-containing protein [Candidatus Campbellbacteria bacterium]